MLTVTNVVGNTIANNITITNTNETNFFILTSYRETKGCPQFMFPTLYILLLHMSSNIHLYFPRNFLFGDL